jgi:hypothetical protein
VIGPHEEHQRAAGVDGRDNRRDAAPGGLLAGGLGGQPRAVIGERGDLGHREVRRGAGERHGLVLRGHLTAGADRADHLAVERQRDPADQRRRSVQRERAQPPVGDLLLDLAAGTHEDGGGARLVGRDA